MQLPKSLDWGFVAAPLPFILLLTYSFILFPRVGDFNFHSTYEGNTANYPPGAAYLRMAFEPALTNEWALFVLSIMLSSVLPYIVFFEITHNQLASFAYLYGSGIALSLQYLWFVPQALIQLFMLLGILNPWLFLLFIAGPWIHASWLPALAVGIAGYLIKGRFA